MSTKSGGCGPYFVVAAPLALLLLFMLAKGDCSGYVSLKHPNDVAADAPVMPPLGD